MNNNSILNYASDYWEQQDNQPDQKEKKFFCGFGCFDQEKEENDQH